MNINAKLNKTEKVLKMSLERDESVITKITGKPIVIIRCILSEILMRVRATKDTLPRYDENFPPPLPHWLTKPNETGQ